MKLFKRLATFVLVSAALLLASAVDTTAAVPRIINYQGRLADNTGAPLTGTYDITFKIYAVASGPGSPLWTETHNAVNVKNGLFTVALGQSVDLSAAYFTDQFRWLGITLSGQPEMSPRTQFAASPYAYVAEVADSIRNGPYVLKTGDTMSGTLNFQQEPSNIAAQIVPIGSTGFLNLYDLSSLTAQLQGNSWGTLLLKNRAGTTEVILDAGGSSGGWLSLLDASGATKIHFNSGAVGDGAVMLPNQAINHNEILDGPGIASNAAYYSQTLNSLGSDLVVITIATPADGYIVLSGKAYFNLYGTTAVNMVTTVISETSGGVYDAPYFEAVGSSGYVNTDINAFTAHPQRVYYKTAGTYTFYLSARQVIGSFGTAIGGFGILTASYFPIAYGAVNAMVSATEAGAFENKTTQVVGNSNLVGATKSQTMYQVDLRELEQKAARLRAEADKAERELAEARLKKPEISQGQK